MSEIENLKQRAILIMGKAADQRMRNMLVELLTGIGKIEEFISRIPKLLDEAEQLILEIERKK